MEWNEEKAQEIVKKHKNRFSIRLTLKIIRVLAAIFILYVIYKMAVMIPYEMSNIGERNTFIQKLAIDWTNPEYTTPIGVYESQEINAFFTQTIDIPIERRIGKSDYIVTEATLTKPLITAFSHFEMEKPYPYDSYMDRFSFYLPEHPETGAKMSGNQPNGVWETLEQIHEGHVADMAFSTAGYFSPGELLQALKPYDVDILWMPLYMGEMDIFEEHGWGGGGNSMSLGNPWGLSGAREVSDDYKSGSLAKVIDENTVASSQEVMLSNMNQLLEDHKGIAEQLLGTQHLEERYEYLSENGFQVYGAVVTGPVKELLKLQDVEEFHSFYLGEIKPWNWDNE